MPRRQDPAIIQPQLSSLLRELNDRDNLVTQDKLVQWLQLFERNVQHENAEQRNSQEILRTELEIQLRSLRNQLDSIQDTFESKLKHADTSYVPASQHRSDVTELKKDIGLLWERLKSATHQESSAKLEQVLKAEIQMRMQSEKVSISNPNDELKFS